MKKDQLEIAQSVSEAEIEVLKQLWNEAPLSALQIIEGIGQKTCTEVHPRTIKTLINRLLKKGALSYIEKDRKFFYSSVIDRDVFYEFKTSSFLDKYFDGGLTPLLSFFSQKRNLNDKDIVELKRLIPVMLLQTQCKPSYQLAG